ncbi:hypothetical protein RT99_05880 [Flavobacterium sp. MEB061]|uniref:hypothetical protein n=1 Tax=Flavobacterium sp. MEB061 TaxID=1587524 RepID=UPI0005AC0C77|nr:hypothetical protein [Flavobacterium sp. MEB061]KIQ22636.1 hypothetical protein RT99_05880 [Flavobacterium sp. MEB061]
MRKVTHKPIVEFHKSIADAHKQINGFYRFNWNEITGKFRSGIQTPALLLESHDSGLNTNSNNTTTFNGRNISFILLDFTGKVDNYAKQEEVLDNLENIGLDIASYLKKLNGDGNSWLFGLFVTDSWRMEKVGPIFDNMYGWNILYTLKNHESLSWNGDNWEFPEPQTSQI